MKHIIILSSKSSGSTALQTFLKENLGFKTTKFTQHQEEETLYWSKVASVLGLPQEKMYGSVVPYKPERAVLELNDFFKENDLPEIKCTVNTTEEEFQEYYYRLMQRVGPNFVEKSPHHLYNESNLQLIENFKRRYKGKVEIIVIGLIRHPQAVLYSAWSRWKYTPLYFQEEWRVSYRNLKKWKRELDIITLKYEDMVAYKREIPSLVGVEMEEEEEEYGFRSSSIEKWRNDSKYGFKLSRKTKKIAKQFGYEEFSAGKSFSWPFYNLKNSLTRAAIVVMRSLRFS